MYCYKCGKEIPDDAIFCPKCGTKRKDSKLDEVKPDKVRADETKSEAVTPEEVKPVQTKSNNRILLFALLGCAVVICGIVAGYFVNRFYFGANNETTLTSDLQEKDEAGETESKEAVESVEEQEAVDPIEENSEGENTVKEITEEEVIVEEDSEEEETVEEELIISNVRIGDHITFGSYDQDGNDQNGKEPIEWEVLDVDQDGALLISRYVLDCVPYNNEYKNVTWETCSLRKWMNEKFYNEAFSEKEKKAIRPSLVINESNQLWATTGGNNTNDNIFCLSVSEILRYYRFNNWYNNYQMGYSQDLLGEYTFYAKEVNNGTLWTYTFNKSFRNDAREWEHGSAVNYTDSVIGKSVAAWWLRSPGRNLYSACYVGGHGDAGASCDRDITNGDFGVRPALWVKTQ